jgi:hypothetical protein
MDAHPGPRLSVKCAYYLTDLTDPDQGKATDMRVFTAFVCDCATCSVAKR